MTTVLRPGSVSLDTLAEIYWHAEGAPVSAALAPECYDAVERAADTIAEITRGTAPVYGVNTGFGKLASVRIPSTDLERLQRNLIVSHSCGVGDPLAASVVRLVMVLKLISLGRGASGVVPGTVRLLEQMLARDVIPVVPGQGSVGASGDLAPLAHLAGAMMGEGDAVLAGERMPAHEALGKVGLTPIVLRAKEGLALINGTQVSTALALAGLFRAHRAARAALITGAMSTDAAMGSSAPFMAEVHDLRGQPGQIETARALRLLLKGSEIRASHLEGDERVQDPYCIRCQPQVQGACLDLLRTAGRTLEIEANAVTDNPLVLRDGRVVSGGNFHAEPVAFAADQIALAVAEIGSISQRRIAVLVDPKLSFGLPPFLTPDPGLNSGLMAAEITSAALMSENKQRAAPASIDSTPTSADQEDHVSMACHAGRRLLPMTRNLFGIIGIEAIAGAQGIDARAPVATSPELRRAHDRLRQSVPVLGDDRLLTPDLEAAIELIASGELCEAVSPDILPELSAS